jgi:hypothetical protein
MIIRLEILQGSNSLQANEPPQRLIDRRGGAETV